MTQEDSHTETGEVLLAHLDLVAGTSESTRANTVEMFLELLEACVRNPQRQHLAAVRLLFDSLMMRGVVEYNPAARARPPRLVRESSHTPVFEEAEIVAFLDSITLESLKDIRDKAIFSVLLYSWCRVSPLINLSVADNYERGGTRLATVPRKTRERTRGSGALEG
jgi:site-specific recombinase XerD